MVGLLTVGGRLRRLLLAMALLWVGRVRLLGRLLRPLCGAPPRAGVGLARGMALTLPSTIRGTLGARHLENPSKR